MRIILNKIGSVTRNMRLNREVTLSDEIEAVEGSVLACRVLNEKSVYNQLEDVHGRMITLHKGDLIAGALGHRNALHGYEGVIPASVKVGDTLNLLNLGGVIGECKSYNSSVGPPFQLEVLGQIQLFPMFQSRVGQPANIRSSAIAPRPDAPSVPVVYVAGTCMNSGKTAAACSLVQTLTRAGYRVGGAKLTGVSLMRDVLSMKDYGAHTGFDFTDAGYVSSGPATAPTITRTIFSALATEKIDIVVAEMGDGLLGEYGVSAILDEPDLRSLSTVFVLCANDPVGVFGGVRLLKEAYSLDVDVVCGPATDNRVGVRYVEDKLSIPAINARSDADRLGELVRGLVEKRRPVPRTGAPGPAGVLG